VGIAATLKVENGKIVGATVAACGVGERARRLPAAEAALTRAIPGKGAFSEAGEAAVAALDPHFGVHADAAYRRDLVRTLTARALSDAAERAA
jgi:carbon-monoxide dehydrogenase medium subunit